MSQFALVDKKSGKILFKKTNTTSQFYDVIKSTEVSGLKRFPYLLKMLFLNREIFGVDVVVDVENSFEEIRYQVEEQTFLSKKGLTLNSTSINGETFTNSVIVDSIKSFQLEELQFINFQNITGKFNIVVQYSENNINWFDYDVFEIDGSSTGSSKTSFRSNFIFSSSKIVELQNNSMYIRIKLSGNGNISTTNSQVFFITLKGNKIIKSYYEVVEDNETDIFVVSSNERSLELSRDLSHKDDFYGTNEFDKKNQRQIIDIKILDSSGTYKSICKEVYTENFINNLLLLEPITEEYYLFESYDYFPPKISVPSQTKQLLHKKDNGFYINKRIITNSYNLINFGYKIIEGVKVINNDNDEQSDVVLNDLDKLDVKLSVNTNFADITISEEYQVMFVDVDGKNIINGELVLSDDNDNNIEFITSELKNKKTFYKITVIIYNEKTEELITLMKALKSGIETPQTVFLVNTNPNDSNIENCVFDKMELGQNSFYSEIEKAVDRNVGLQFNTQEELTEIISDYINECIRNVEKTSVTNAVGINYYNFTNSIINKEHLSAYGFYVHNEIKEIKNNLDKVITVGESEDNSITNLPQFDIGSPLGLLFDVTDCSEYIKEEITNPDDLTPYFNLEQFKEDEDNKLSFSITHIDNLRWKYVNGIEEIEVYSNVNNLELYDIKFAANTEDTSKVNLSVMTNYSFDEKYRGNNNITLNVKNKNGIIMSYPFDFIVDYKEPEINEFYIKTTDEITESPYVGKKDLEYTKDNFFEVGLRLDGEYDFYNKGYKILIKHKDNPDYKIERLITEKFTSKTFNFHLDDILDENDLDKKIKFGTWICELIRIDYNYAIRTTEYEIVNTILDSLELIAQPVEPDYEDFENNGLQQGKDVYIKILFNNSTYFTKIRDFIYYCKEIRFIVNNVNFTSEENYFTYLHQQSLNSVTSHLSQMLDERNEMRWLISGQSEEASNEYLEPIANLEGNEKKVKNIKIQFVLFDNNKIIETNLVTIGETGKVTSPIILGSSVHYEKLKLIEAKNLGVDVDDLTPEDLQNIKEKMDSLAELNYSNQQIIASTRTFVFYSYLAEIQFDFGICEYFTITQNDNTTDLIPITRDGKVRYVLDENGIDDNSKTRLTIKGYVQLADGKTLSSEEVSVDVYRKKYPSMINTGNDYTRYVLYRKEDNYYRLQTLIQSKIELDNVGDTYSNEWMKYIKVDLVDIDKRTVVASAPNVVFYDGFIPQTVVFDTGISSDVLNKLEEDERLDIEQAVQYEEIEKLLNDKIFSKDKHIGQTFYLRFTGIESYIDAFSETKEIKGKESFFPVNFEESLTGLRIAPSSGVVITTDNSEEMYYTYKNKVNFVIESNNAEYYMYRTDRTAAFQKIYPTSVGYSKIARITMSTYEIGNHVLEIKQKALGETESNVYSVIVEKIQSPTPPKLVGLDVTDENPEWTLYPIEDAEKYDTYIISEEVEHSKKTLGKLQYEVIVEPEKYLENGYHILVANSIDKIGNSSDESYFITRKISIPVCSTIQGVDKTSEDVITWTWETQYNDGVRNYEIEINGIDKVTIPAATSGYNEYNLRFFQGKKLEDGIYEIRVWAINELGNKSFKYSSFITEKGSKIKELVVELYKFNGDYTNKLEATVIKRDDAVKSIEYQIFSNNNGILTEYTELMSTSNNELLFLDKNGVSINLEDGNYYFAVRGVNNIGEKTEFIRTAFIYKTTLPEKPFIYYKKNVKTESPIFFAKPSGIDSTLAIEIKIGDNPYEEFRNNCYRPNYQLNYGINNVIFRVTDYAGNIAEYTDFIEITDNGINLFQEDYMVDMTNPVLKLDFNLQEMNNYGHTNFRVEQENLGIDVIVNIKNANTIEIPLTSENKVFPDGIYVVSIKLYDDLTKGYDYIAGFFSITIDSNKPEAPYFLNNGYDNIETNKNYTQNKMPKWLWQTRDITNLKEYIVNLYVYDKTENDYIEYGNKQFSEYSTGMSGQFQTIDELDDGTYKLTVRCVGNNSLSSEDSSFIFVIKNTLPNPPYFDITKSINRKYENTNKNITWQWNDLNDSDNELVSYKIKINDEEFSDEIIGKINFYTETRTLKDGNNKITVIGKDKAGNWSTANEITANQLGLNYLSHTKIIDTVLPNDITQDDVKSKILDSKSFELFFKENLIKDEYYIFELYSLTSDNEEVLFSKGNTLDIGTEFIYFMNKEVVPGIEIGELDGNLGYCEIKINTENNTTNKSLYFTNLPSNIYYLRLYRVDYSGNSSASYTIEIALEDITKLKPQFILPKELHTNNSTIIYQWILNESNILYWEYQLVTPYSNSTVDLVDDVKWKKIEDNSFSINNIPRTIGGKATDGDYTLYVRAVFDEIILQEGTELQTYKKSSHSSITVTLDRTLPKGVIFTNKGYTDDNSVLKWSWEYTGDGDNVDGVYVSFNPNLMIEEWEKLSDVTEYTSFKDRSDGVYTLYLKTFDLAGNINETIFSNSIVLDRIAPFKPIINGGTNIFTNFIPTISWENDNNYYKYAWLLLTKTEFQEFNEIYNNLITFENYSLTNDDWSYLFDKFNNYDENNVHESLKTLTFTMKKNDVLIENQVTLNSTENKNGISQEGEYVFLLSGFDQNNNWAEEFAYQFITYDITAPDLTKIKFEEPKYVITNIRRPKWVWTVPGDVIKCKYSLEKNGYDDGSISGILENNNSISQEVITYSFEPDYNLTKGDYRLIVNCYDSAGNNIEITKSVIIEDESIDYESEYFDIILPGINNIVRCKMNKYSSVYIIIDATIDSNSVLTYRKTEDKLKSYKVYEFGKTELELETSYEFNITSYEVIIE